MAEKLFKWLAALAAFILGLGLVLQPTLISSLPRILHFILGFVLIGMAGYAVYKEAM